MDRITQLEQQLSQARLWIIEAAKKDGATGNGTGEEVVCNDRGGAVGNNQTQQVSKEQMVGSEEFNRRVHSTPNQKLDGLQTTQEHRKNDARTNDDCVEYNNLQQLDGRSSSDEYGYGRSRYGQEYGRRSQDWWWDEEELRPGGQFDRGGYRVRTRQMGWNDHEENRNPDEQVDRGGYRWNDREVDRNQGGHVDRGVWRCNAQEMDRNVRLGQVVHFREPTRNYRYNRQQQRVRRTYSPHLSSNEEDEYPGDYIRPRRRSVRRISDAEIQNADRRMEKWHLTFSGDSRQRSLEDFLHKARHAATAFSARF